MPMITSCGMTLTIGEGDNDSIYGKPFMSVNPRTSDTNNERQPNNTAIIDAKLLRSVTKVNRNPIAKIVTIR